MKINRLRSKPASIAKTRWAAYAVAGAATAFVGSNSAEAAIHYSGLLNEQFPGNRDKHKAFPLDQPGDSLRFAHRATFCESAIFSINGIVSAAFIGYHGVRYFVSKLSFGQNISAGGVFIASHGVMAIAHDCYTYGGDWDTGGTGYVGFRFNNGAGIQYGWARVTTTGKVGGNGFRVVAYAYADPGEPITAGQRPGDEQAPVTGSLGWLALGAAGLLAWRKGQFRTAS